MVVGFEVGTYNTSSDWPQGVTFTHCLAARTEYGFAVYAGDAIRLIDSGSLQCKNNGLLLLGKSHPAAVRHRALRRHQPELQRERR